MTTTDAFGSHGGIAQYNRDLLTALAAAPEVVDVVVAPRHIHFAPGTLPNKLRYYVAATSGKLCFIWKVIAIGRGGFDLIICGHLNLLPVAALANLKTGAPLGVDEVLEVIPNLVHRKPALAFLVAGGGDDRSRLEKKAGRLGAADRVVFTGFVARARKSGHPPLG